MENVTYTVEEIARIVNPAGLKLNDPHVQISELGYDSRKITNPDQTLFFALKGRRDGHQFIKEAYLNGVRSFVVAVDFDAAGLNDCNFIAVADTLVALQSLAAYHRNRFHYPLIGITGSNGKTIVKEWLYQLLSPYYHIIRSPKSYNSQLGVALSLWEMNTQHNMAIIEAGISKQGEMATLQKMIKPTVGVLTNIGHAHDEGFASSDQKLIEKLRLFSEADNLIFSPRYLNEGEDYQLPPKQFTWSMQGTADLKVIRQEGAQHQFTRLTALYKEQEVTLLVPFTDVASLENVICCWAVMLALGFETSVIADGVLKLQAVSMRLVLKQGLNNCSIIDDSYSNDLSSLSIALDFLRQQKQHANKVVILSDISTEKTYQSTLYEALADLLTEQHLQQFIGVGPIISRYARLFPEGSIFFPDTEALLKQLAVINLRDASVLIKGARVFGFERISKALVFQTHETTLEINLSAIEHNLNTYKGLLAKNTKLMVMVKAFSYGSGSFEIANLLQFNKVDYLTVAYVDEGITLRRAGITLPIVVMSPGLQDFDQMILHQLEPEIYSFTEFRYFLEKLDEHQQKHYPIHLKVDTGMHRLGFDPGDLSALLVDLKGTERVQVGSVFSHLAASSDSTHDAFTQEQINKFKAFTEAMSEELNYPFIRHIANTSAITRFPEAQFDMVRLGIGLYGVQGDEGKRLPIMPVAQLKTGITQIKNIKAGETIGYNRHGHLNGAGTIATVKIGYADGYSRRFGNGVGKMLVNGHVAPIVGDVCMDMCMLDITGIECKEGDEVIVIGEQLSVTALAERIGTIPYEILTGISQRVRRIYFYE